MTFEERVKEWFGYATILKNITSLRQEETKRFEISQELTRKNTDGQDRADDLERFGFNFCSVLGT